jgi:hypothetical protein
MISHPGFKHRRTAARLWLRAERSIVAEVGENVDVVGTLVKPGPYKDD